MDSPTLDSDKLEMCLLSKDKDGNVKYRQMKPKELNARIKKYQKEHKDEDKDDEI